MKTAPQSIQAAVELRRQAEERLLSQATGASLPRTMEETQRLLHELDVHHIELEMQNIELCRALAEAESSRSMYADLYDFAPIGYFTLDGHGQIQEVNHIGTKLLGKERRLLINKPFIFFIEHPDSRKLFANHLKAVLEKKGIQRCEIKLTGSGPATVWGQVQSIAVDTEGGKESYILSSIMDVTAARQMTMELQIAHDTLELIVRRRTAELTQANMKLLQEIDERKGAEESLQTAYREIKQLKDRLQAENIYLRQEIAQKDSLGEVVGQGNGLSYVFLRVEQVAPQNATVLILGETGTGKGMIARAIHSISDRKDRPMITVNCSSLPANLIESELFGREKGAFTGANARQIGRFELADGGTIFLDEIGEMPMELQCKLLRVIQEGEFERLGSPHTIKIDLRIIAATNRNLEDEIKAGSFRADLFYRLNVFPIEIPPLRQRQEDIPLFVDHFLDKFNKKIGKKIQQVSSETLNALQGYHWPGNVRELESVIERAVITSQGATLQVLDQFVKGPTTAGPVAGQPVKPLADLDRDHILQVLQKTKWRVEGTNGAAVLLGLNPSTLRARIRKYGIARQ